jgi:hypothetical protein
LIRLDCQDGTPSPGTMPGFDTTLLFSKIFAKKERTLRRALVGTNNCPIMETARNRCPWTRSCHTSPW